jgi:hypothetical protein
MQNIDTILITWILIEFLEKDHRWSSKTEVFILNKAKLTNKQWKNKPDLLNDKLTIWKMIIGKKEKIIILKILKKYISFVIFFSQC